MLGILHVVSPRVDTGPLHRRAMQIVLKPGERIDVCFEDSDGTIQVAFERDAIIVSSELPDTSGREGVIYREVFSDPDIDDGGNPAKPPMKALMWDRWNAPPVAPPVLPTLDADHVRVTSMMDYCERFPDLSIPPEVERAFRNGFLVVDVTLAGDFVSSHP